MLGNILEKLGYEPHDTKVIGFDERRILAKHNKKGWVIFKIDESEVEGVVDITYKEKEYNNQLKNQLKNKHYKTMIEAKKHF